MKIKTELLLCRPLHSYFDWAGTIMISYRLFRVYNFFCPPFAVLGIIPFTWNPESLIFQRCPRARHRFLFNFTLLFTWFLLNGLVQCIRYIFAKNYTLFTIVYIFTLISSIDCGFWSIFVFFEDDVISCLNGMLICMRRMQSKFLISCFENDLNL